MLLCLQSVANVPMLLKKSLGTLQVLGGGVGQEGPHHNFVVIAPVIDIMKFGTGVKLDVFYTMVTKNCDVTIIMSL